VDVELLSLHQGGGRKGFDEAARSEKRIRKEDEGKVEQERGKGKRGRLRGKSTSRPGGENPDSEAVVLHYMTTQQEFCYEVSR
jgi:hypothetical protein